VTEPLTLEPDLDEMGPDDSAPFGYMIDRASGERRAKKRPGKQAPAPPPELAELKTDQEPPPEDRAPGPIKRVRRGRRGRGGRPAPEPEMPAPPFRAGPIAKGVNKLYVRAGKILRVWDPMIGAAVIASTRKEAEEDVTVGEAWEEIARINPRIRSFLLKIIAGGAWGQLFAAHLPILLVILMKDGIRKWLPFQRIVESMMAPDDDSTPVDEAAAGSGLRPEDLTDMMAFAQGMMMRTMGGMPRGGGVVDAEVVPPEQS